MGQSRRAFAGRQLDAEAGAALAAVGVKGELTAQQRRPASRQRQAQADPAAGRLVLAAAERAEDGPSLAHRNAGAAVLDLQDQPTLFLSRPQPDAVVLGVAAVLAGVVDQVGE